MASGSGIRFFALYTFQISFGHCNPIRNFDLEMYGDVFVAVIAIWSHFDREVSNISNRAEFRAKTHDEPVALETNFHALEFGIELLRSERPADSVADLGITVIEH